jgi:hypothetical protein
MEDSPGEAPAADVPPAAGAVGPAAAEGAAAVDGHDGAPAAACLLGDAGAADDPAHLGRPDLSQDAIQELRDRRRRLRQEQRRLKNEERNAQRKRARIVKKLKNLDTASVVQMLLERGLAVRAPAPAAPAPPPAALPGP